LKFEFNQNIYKSRYLTLPISKKFSHILYFSETDSKEYEIEKIIFHETINNEILYFVKWKNCGLNKNTWEPEENLINCPDILKAYKTKRNSLKNKR